MGLKSKPTPHPTPLDDGLLDSLRLIRSHRVGNATWHRLIGQHGSARAALEALPEIAAGAHVKNYKLYPYDSACRELEAGFRAGAQPILWGSAAYPPLLADLADAPPILWAKGNISLLTKPSIAVVGSRNASSLGLRMAHHMAQGLGQAGWVISSGMARGIDRAAHEAALESGTIAVVAGGVDVIYPEENSDLAKNIISCGCMISEQPVGMRPQARHFPQRNRIIAGLAHATLVVEAASRSGSLITARIALDQGREVLAVPGHPFDMRAAGCNILLRDGATLARNVRDVLDVVPEIRHVDSKAPKALPARAKPGIVSPHITVLPGPTPTPRTLSDVSNVHDMILDRLSPSPILEDRLIRDLGVPAATVTAHVLTLELEGKVQRGPGGTISKVC